MFDYCIYIILIFLITIKAKSLYLLRHSSGACNSNIIFSDNFSANAKRGNNNNKINLQLFDNITLNDIDLSVSINRGDDLIAIGLGSFSPVGASSSSFIGGCAEAYRNGHIYHPWWEIPCTCQLLLSDTRDTIQIMCQLSVNGNSLIASRESERDSNMYSSNTMTYLCTGQYQLSSKDELTLNE